MTLFRLLERNEAVLVEKRDGDKLEKLWVATASDVFKLLE